MRNDFGEDDVMNITFDPAAKRATDLDSGMAVEWGGENPYPKEMQVYFILYWKGKKIQLTAGWADAFPDVRKEHPDWSSMDVMKKADEVGILNYYIHNFDEYIYHPSFLSEGDGETLVRLVLRVAKEAGIKLMATKKTRVHFLNKPEFSLYSKWSVEE
jgi:hypothetical protein